MYELQFFATDDADWAQRVDLTDDRTNLPLDTTDVLFELEVSCRGSTYLSATTADNSIEIPEAGTIQWRFTKEQMRSLDIRNTYKVGCRMTNGTGTTQLFTGSLVFVGGGFGA
ncbi:hypothetical protein PRN20_18265 [Devosia sp. ZB163]|uniref:hypothetical protein n=1 Tax=Devosia sp. ZB163 TaxID=3025938 RepID=UPI002361DBF4|nr:hypothetical protein [Devosia sp. ZB163]MDC9825683.1 hypothetical protein [Devosia sp. ZB163]